MMTTGEKELLLNLLTKLIMSVKNDIKPTTPCHECKSWDGGYCRKYEMMIPKEHQENGCESWEYDPYAPPF